MIETGLGGRLDATNVLVPALTVITDISMDHTEILGETLAEIASEKAGIIKPGVLNLSGRLPTEAARVIDSTCRKRNAPLQALLPREFVTDDRRLSLDFQSDGLSLKRVTPSLLGVHQLKNCALTLKAVAALRSAGFSIPKTSIRKGLRTVEFPGRFQVLGNGSISPRFVLDVCHNRAGAVAFADTFSKRFPGRGSIVLLGLVKRKEHQGIVDALAPIADSFHLVPLRSKRSCDAAELVKALDWHGRPVTRSARFDTALSRLLKSASSDDIISVVGSHYLVGEFLSKRVAE